MFSKGYSRILVSLSFLAVIYFCVVPQARAQTDIHIAGAQAGFPVAVPQLCDGGGASDVAARIPELVSKDLQISGLFKLLNPSTFIESPGKCGGVSSVAYSDWSVIGADGLVRGQVQLTGAVVRAELYLLDVAQQKAVIGKRYESDSSDYAKIAHRFANEIIGYFTGQKGVFGTRISYVSKLGRFKELFVMDLDGSNQRQLTHDKGIVLSGGTSLLLNLDKLIINATGVPVHVAEDPLFCVVRGTGVALENIDLYKRSVSHR